MFTEDPAQWYCGTHVLNSKKSKRPSKCGGVLNVLVAPASPDSALVQALFT